jgi:alkylation response protein AidB-like acyl-CoA dehydrogenase
MALVDDPACDHLIVCQAGSAGQASGGGITAEYCRLRLVKVFSEQHDMFRGAVRSFVDKEVAPHVEAWETAGRMPKALWRRMGELGFFGLEYDEKYGGGGADVMMSAVLHEECARSRSGSFAMAVGVHCDMASPHLYWTGSEALKEKNLPAICRGAHGHRRHRARRRQRRRGHPHPRGP